MRMQYNGPAGTPESAVKRDKHKLELDRGATKNAKVLALFCLW